MSKPLHFYLTGVRERACLHQLPSAQQELLFFGTANLMFQLVADVEVVFQGALATTGNDRHMLKTRIPRFLYAVLDQRFIHNRQHFLGHGLCGGQKAGAVASCGEKAFTDHVGVLLYIR
ncbi:hypothetical protein D3C81_892740 [compost metagenome]